MPIVRPKNDTGPAVIARPAAAPSTQSRGPALQRALPAADPSLAPGDYVVRRSVPNVVGRVMQLSVPNGTRVLIPGSGQSGEGTVIGPDPMAPDLRGIVQWSGFGGRASYRWADMRAQRGWPHVAMVRWTGDLRDAAARLDDLLLFGRARSVVLDPDRELFDPMGWRPNAGGIANVPRQAINVVDTDHTRDAQGLINWANRRNAPPPTIKKKGVGAGAVLGGSLVGAVLLKLLKGKGKRR